MARTRNPEWVAFDASQKRYRRAHQLVGWCDRVVKFLWLFHMLLSPDAFDWEIALADRLGRVGGIFAFLGIWMIGGRILALPFSAWSQQVERSFGLSKQSWKSWLGDECKGTILVAVFGALALGGLLAAFALGGPLGWWLPAGVMAIAATVLLVQLAPVLLVPIFYPMTPLEEGPLRTRLLALCERFKIPVKEVFSLGLGAKTEKGNAAFFGLGKTKRIAVGDTLHKNFPIDEVEAVFAHELGHERHNDLWRGIALSTVTTFATFALTAYLYVGIVEGIFGLLGSNASSILAMTIVLGLVGIPFRIAMAMHSRARERAADGFAIGLGLAAPLGSALERLTLQNRGRFYPNPLLEWLLHSHPAPARRIERMRRPN